MIRSDYLGLYRPSLRLDPITEPHIYVERETIKDLLIQKIERSLLTNSKFHFVVWGPEGAGKTHCLRHIENYIKRVPKCRVWYTQCPSLQAPSTFADFYKHFWSDTFAHIFPSIFDRLLSEIANIEPRLRLHYLMQKTGWREACKLVLYWDKDSELVWRWLSGEVCSRDEKIALGIYYDNSVASAAIKTTEKLFQVYRRFFNAPVCLIDDYDRAENIFLPAYFDQLVRIMIPYSSFIIAYTGWPWEIFEAQTCSQIGKNNFLQLGKLSESECERFIFQLIEKFRSSKPINQDALEKAKETTGEESQMLYFPFTNKAINRLLAITARLPAVIQDIMTDAIAESLEKGLCAISSSLIDTILTGSYSKLLFYCKECGNLLEKVDIPCKVRAGRKVPLSPKCEICGSNLTFIFPLLKEIALDTSAIVDGIASTLFNVGLVSQLKVLIPNAAISEISYWEKSPNKFPLAAKAKNELDTLRTLESQRKISIEVAGPRPTRAQITLARKGFNEMDYLIIDTALRRQFTLVTSDKLMAQMTAFRHGRCLYFKAA